MNSVFSNFDILQECCPELADIGHRAEVLLYTDNDLDACDAKIARFIERLTSIIMAANSYSLTEQRSPLSEKIEILLQDQIITPQIYSIMGTLRKVRNEVAHAVKEYSEQECSEHLQLIYKLAVWFVQVYVDGAFIATDFKPLTGQIPMALQPVSKPDVTHLVVSDKEFTSMQSAAIIEDNRDLVQHDKDAVALDSQNLIIDRSITKEDHVRRSNYFSYGLFGFHLKGDQVQVVCQPLSGHHIVKGVAGSGKTYCALKRAERAVYEKGGDVLLLAFNRIVLNAMNSLFKTPNKNITLCTYHQFAARLYREISGRYPVICQNNEEIIYQALEATRSEHPQTRVLYRDLSFYINEISWMEQFGYCDKDSYLSADRIGRSSQNLRRIDRDPVFDVYAKYCLLLSDLGYDCDYDGLAYYLNKMLDEHDLSCPYSEIIIDEGQDFSPMMLQTVTRYAAKKSSIMWLGDMGQCIFSNSRISWKNVGFNVRKSIILTKNYRTTKEIAAFADAIRAEMDLIDEDGIQTESCISGGALPDVRLAESVEQEQAWVVEAVRRWMGTRRSICIILPSWSLVQEYVRVLSEYSPNMIRRTDESLDTTQGLFLAYYQQIKGLEFDRVIMPSCQYSSFANNADMLSFENKLEQRKHLARLIYVAITRARERLLITATDSMDDALPLYEGMCKANFPLKAASRKSQISIEEDSFEEQQSNSIPQQSMTAGSESMEGPRKQSSSHKNYTYDKNIPVKVPFGVGKLAIHKDYGQGKVIKIEGHYITIDFNGTKRKFVYPHCVDSGYIEF